MKPEEAIKAIEVLRDIDINYPPTQEDVANTEGAVELAIQALEKQVAKKPESIPFDKMPHAWLDRCSGDGHEKHIDENGDIVYSDNNISIDEFGFRPCAKCGEYPNADGDDYCIQNLGRVTNACCGHGSKNGYIQFDNGITIRGKFDVEHSNKIDIDYQIRSRQEILNRIDAINAQDEKSLEEQIELTSLKWVMRIGDRK